MKGGLEMSIVKLKDKRTGTTYVYESESYWDKEKKQPRSRRKLIARAPVSVFMVIRQTPFSVLCLILFVIAAFRYASLKRDARGSS